LLNARLILASTIDRHRQGLALLNVIDRQRGYGATFLSLEME
jgi:hypothetical protein